MRVFHVIWGPLIVCPYSVLLFCYYSHISPLLLSPHWLLFQYCRQAPCLYQLQNNHTSLIINRNNNVIAKEHVVPTWGRCANLLISMTSTPQSPRRWKTNSPTLRCPSFSFHHPSSPSGLTYLVVPVCLVPSTVWWLVEFVLELSNQVFLHVHDVQVLVLMTKVPLVLLIIAAAADVIEDLPQLVTLGWKKTLIFTLSNKISKQIIIIIIQSSYCDHSSPTKHSPPFRTVLETPRQLFPN